MSDFSIAKINEKIDLGRKNDGKEKNSRLKKRKTKK